MPSLAHREGQLQAPVHTEGQLAGKQLSRESVLLVDKQLTMSLQYAGSEKASSILH